jgi:uncharacterized membrane protein
MSLKTVVGLFESRQQAEEAVSELRAKNFSHEEISLVSKDDRSQSDSSEGRSDMETGDLGMDSDVSTGTAWGSALGGATGLALSAGALAIPGIGPIVAMGPLAATLGGAVTGGLAGGLLDLGIPENEGRDIENEIRGGSTLAVVETDESRAEEAAEILRSKGAKSTKIRDRS